MRAFRLVLVAVALGSASGCGIVRKLGMAPNQPDPETVKVKDPAPPEPDRVECRVVLVSFEQAKSKMRGVTRTQAEAERLAARVHELARNQRQDFGELVRLYSDDRHGDGRLGLCNWGVEPRDENDGRRQELPPALCETAFRMQPGDVALVPYDPQGSPLGYCVVRRER